MSKNQQKPAKRKTKSQSSRKPFAVSKPIQREFKMKWEVNDANRMMDLHHLLFGTYFDENGYPKEDLITQLAIYCNSYKGSLAIAMKAELIPYRHKFTMKSKVTIKNIKTGIHEYIHLEMVCHDELSILEFLEAESVDGYTYYIEEAGIKKRWIGFMPELKKILDDFGDEYEALTNHCELSCVSAFYTYEHARAFKALELLHNSKDILPKAA